MTADAEEKLGASDVEFFDKIVKPTVDEFAESPLDLRLACLSALVLSSMADHHLAAHPHLCRGGKGAYRRLLAGDPAIALVHDVADATKHASLRGDRKGLTFNQVERREHIQVGGWDTGSFAWDVAGAWGGRAAMVVKNVIAPTACLTMPFSQCSPIGSSGSMKKWGKGEARHGDHFPWVHPTTLPFSRFTRDLYRPEPY